MRIFDHFPPGAKCPVCHTSEEGQCLLVPIYGSWDKSNTGEGLPFHVKCLSLQYFPNQSLIAQVIQTQEG